MEVLFFQATYIKKYANIIMGQSHYDMRER